MKILTNKKLVNYIENIKNKKIAVLGLGISNYPLIKFLSKYNNNISIFDRKNNEDMLLKIKSLGDYKYFFGENYLDNLNGYDIIFRTPGLRPDHPNILKEISNGAELTSEMELFVDLCPAQIFGITGSDGKTTTTTLIYNILKEHGYNCYLGGNIGTPLLDKIEEISIDDKVVLELSSFQLMTFKKSVDVAVVTNITPNHLDMHTNMDEYVEAKKNIFKFSQNKKLIINYDNEITNSFKDTENSVLFSRRNILKNGAFLKGDHLFYKDNDFEMKIVNIKDIKIPGMHNVENYLAAICATIDYVDANTISKVAKTLSGVAHRIEFVREYLGVKYYNDSIATSPTRAIAGLNSFDQKLILIAGGKDKNIDYTEFGRVLAQKIKHLILIGATSEKIKNSLLQGIKEFPSDIEIKIDECKTYEEVVLTAKNVSCQNDIVILSPASTSFDMFNNFEERGNLFKELVNKLI